MPLTDFKKNFKLKFLNLKIDLELMRNIMVIYDLSNTFANKIFKRK